LLDLSCVDIKDMSKVNNRGGSKENSDGAERTSEVIRNFLFLLVTQLIANRVLKHQKEYTI
jgi:hypothetical protein